MNTGVCILGNVEGWGASGFAGLWGLAGHWFPTSGRLIKRKMQK